MSKKALVVEDDGNIAELLRLYLERDGFEVQCAPDGGEGVEMFRAFHPDIVLLDIMLPGLNGLEVLRRARRSVDTPVIMLTARDTVMDKVTGLDMGAEDYITKPFEIEELLARIRVRLRKTERRASKALEVGKLSLDPDRHTVHYDGHPVELTHREFELLKILMENEGIVMARSTLMEQVWGYDYMGETNIVDVYMRYLRSKLDDAYGVKLLYTVRGVGYVLRKE